VPAVSRLKVRHRQRHRRSRTGSRTGLQCRTAKAVEKVNQQVKSAGESATRDTKALQAKIAVDVNALKARVVGVKHGLDVKLAEKNAEILE
jgi:hypothetical protein